MAGFAHSSDYSLSLLIRRIAQAFGKRLLDQFRQAGLKVSFDQWLLLVCIYHYDGSNQQGLCEFCGKDRASITRLVDQLEGEGLLDRRPDPSDRRNNRICLTDRGRTFTRHLLDLADQTLAQVTSGLDAAELARCTQTLQTLLANLEANPRD